MGSNPGRVIPKTLNIVPTAFLSGAQHEKKWVRWGATSGLTSHCSLDCFQQTCGLGLWNGDRRRPMRHTARWGLYFYFVLCISAKLCHKKACYNHKLAFKDHHESRYEYYFWIHWWTLAASLDKPSWLFCAFFLQIYHLHLQHKLSRCIYLSCILISCIKFAWVVCDSTYVPDSMFHTYSMYELPHNYL